MKKIISIISILIISEMLIFSPIRITCSFNVEVGNIYTYKLTKSNWKAFLIDQEYNGKGLYFNQNTYPVGTKFLIEVTEISSKVFVSMKIGDESYPGSIDIWDIDGIIAFLYLPEILGENISVLDQAEIESGVPLFYGQFFIAPEVFNDTFSSYITIPPTPNLEFPAINWVEGGFYEIIDNIGIFDWWRLYDITGTDLIYDFKCKIAYDLTTGVLKGVHYLMEMNGTIDGDLYTLNCEQRIVEDGYRLEGLAYTYGLPTINWFLALPVILIVSLLGRLRKRSKT